jgi:hypothetical protein
MSMARLETWFMLSNSDSSRRFLQILLSYMAKDINTGMHL